MPVRFSKRDDFPELWSPTTTSFILLVEVNQILYYESSHLWKRHMLSYILFTKLVYFL